MRLLVGLITLSLLLSCGRGAFCQRRLPNGGPGLNRPPLGAGRPNAGRALPDKAVLELLRKMIRPTVEYAGTQVTVVYGSTQTTSEQIIKGDIKGHIRIDFLSPPREAGDVMLIAPGEFHNFHKHDNLDEMASWPTERNGPEQRMFAWIREGVVTARRTGEEQIAGRNAIIIELSLRNNGIVQRKFWIDPETGIQLQIENYLRGVLSSRTTMRTLTIGSEARVSPEDFLPKFPGANRVPVFPGAAAPYRTLADAQGQLPFRPLEPANLPAGFHLDGVWVFGGEGKVLRQGSVLMRYTDGVSNFSLYQRLAPMKTPVNPPPRSFQNNLQHWLKGSPDGTVHIQFIGHLPREQALALYNSLR